MIFVVDLSENGDDVEEDFDLDIHIYRPKLPHWAC